MLFSTFERSVPPTTTMDTPQSVNGAPNYRWDAVLPWPPAVEIALAIPPGNTRVLKGILGPLAERYGVGSGYPKKHWSECKAEINASSIDELVETIFQQYEEYDSATLERVWQSLFKVHNQTLRKMGDND